MTFDPRFLPSIVRFVHYRFGSVLFVAQIFWSPLDPLPGIEHMIVNAHNEQFDFVVFRDDDFVSGVLFQTLFREGVRPVITHPLGFGIALIRGVFESGQVGFHPSHGVDLETIVPDEGPKVLVELASFVVAIFNLVDRSDHIFVIAVNVHGSGSDRRGWRAPPP